MPLNLTSPKSIRGIIEYIRHDPTATRNEFVGTVVSNLKTWNPAKVGEDFDKIKANWDTYQNYVKPGQEPKTFLGKLGKAKYEQKYAIEESRRALQEKSDIDAADQFQSEIASSPDVKASTEQMTKGWSDNPLKGNLPGFVDPRYEQGNKIAAANLLVGMGNAAPSIVGQRPIKVPKGIVEDPLAQTIGELIPQAVVGGLMPAGAAIKAAKLLKLGSPTVKALEAVQAFGKTGGVVKQAVNTGIVRGGENVAMTVPSVIADRKNLTAAEALQRLGIAGSMGFGGGLVEGGVRAAIPAITKATTEFATSPDVVVPEIAAKRNPMLEARIAQERARVAPDKLTGQALHEDIAANPQNYFDAPSQTFRDTEHYLLENGLIDPTDVLPKYAAEATVPPSVKLAEQMSKGSTTKLNAGLTPENMYDAFAAAKSLAAKGIKAVKKALREQLGLDEVTDDEASILINSASPADAFSTIKRNRFNSDIAKIFGEKSVQAQKVTKPFSSPEFKAKMFKKFLRESKSKLTFRYLERHQLPLSLDEQLGFDDEFNRYFVKQVEPFGPETFQGSKNLPQDLISGETVNPRTDLTSENLTPVTDTPGMGIDKKSKTPYNKIKMRDITDLKGKSDNFTSLNAGITPENYQQVLAIVKSYGAKGINLAKKELRDKLGLTEVTDAELKALAGKGNPLPRLAQFNIDLIPDTETNLTPKLFNSVKKALSNPDEQLGLTNAQTLLKGRVGIPNQEFPIALIIKKSLTRDEAVNSIQTNLNKIVKDYNLNAKGMPSTPTVAPAPQTTPAAPTGPPTPPPTKPPVAAGTPPDPGDINRLAAGEKLMKEVEDAVQSDVEDLRKKYQLEHMDIRNTPAALKQGNIREAGVVKEYDIQAKSLANQAEIVKDLDRTAVSASKLKSTIGDFLNTQSDIRSRYSKLTGARIGNDTLSRINSTLRAGNELTDKQLRIVKRFAMDVVDAKAKSDTAGALGFGEVIVKGSSGRSNLANTTNTVEKIGKVGDWLEAYRYNAMLGAPSTLAKNNLINTLNIAADRYVTTPLAAAFDKGFSKLGSKKTGIRTNVLLAPNIDKLPIKTALDRFVHIYKEGPSALGTQARYNLPETTQLGWTNPTTKTQKAINTALNAGSRGLLAGDTLARTLIEDNRFKIIMKATLGNIFPEKSKLELEKLTELLPIHIKPGAELPLDAEIAYTKLFTAKGHAILANAEALANMKPGATTLPENLIRPQVVDELSKFKGKDLTTEMKRQGIIAKTATDIEARDAYDVLAQNGNDRLSVGVRMATEASRNHADELLLTSKPDRIMDHLNKVVGAGPSYFKPGRWILPFTNVPMNAVKRGLEYTPLGIIQGAVEHAKLNTGNLIGEELWKTQNAAARSYAKGVIGTGVLGIAIGFSPIREGISNAINLGTEGKIKVTPSYNTMIETDRAVFASKGIPAESLIIGNKVYNMDLLGNFGIVLRATVNYDYAMSKNDKEKVFHAIVAAGDSVLGAIPYDDLRDMITRIATAKKSENGFEKFVKSQVSSIAGQYYPNIIKRPKDQFFPGDKKTDSYLTPYGVGNPKFDYSGTTIPTSQTKGNVTSALGNTLLPMNNITEYKNDQVFQTLYKTGIGLKEVKAEMNKKFAEVVLPKDIQQEAQKKAYDIINKYTVDDLESMWAKADTPAKKAAVTKWARKQMSNAVKSAHDIAIKYYARTRPDEYKAQRAESLARLKQ